MINKTNLRFTSFAALALGFLLLATFPAAAQKDNASAAIEKAIKDRITVETKQIKSDALNNVIAGDLYDVTISFGGESGSSTINNKAVLIGDKVIVIPMPTTNEKLADLKAVINPKFKLKTMEDATKLEAALDVLYPISSFGKSEKAIKQSEGKYIFVRGKFFKEFKGFVVTTDGEGSIADISYSLQIK